MDHSHTPLTADWAGPAATIQPAMGTDGRPLSSCLTRGQRWLACATAVAVLLSGLNASVQVWKALLGSHDQPAVQSPSPASPRKFLHKDEPPAVPGGRGTRQAGH